MTEQNDAVGAEALVQVPAGGDAAQPPKADETQAEQLAQDAGDAEGNEAEAQDDADPSGNEGDKPKKKGGFQRQIEKANRETYLAEMRARQAEARLRDLQQGKQTAQQPGQQVSNTAAPDEPKLEQFSTVEEFLAARDKWVTDKVTGQAQEAAQRQIQERQEQERVRTVKAQLDANEAKARAKYRDFDEIVQPFAPILMGNPVIAEYLSGDDTGAGMDVAYHLAKNPALLDELRGMSEIKAVRKLIELEARLKAPPPPKTITQAPDPIKPTGARETVKLGLADLASSDTNAYVKRRRQQEMAKRKG